MQDMGLGIHRVKSGVSRSHRTCAVRGRFASGCLLIRRSQRAVLNHIFQEFWPDMRRNVFRRK